MKSKIMLSLDCFNAKYPTEEIQRARFEDLARCLSCRRYNIPYGISQCVNHAGNETSTIVVDGEELGFQAKYFRNKIDENQIIRSIKKAREGRKPHLYVSKQVAKATNTQVEYTLRKGFNDAECQEWIMKALNDHKVLSRKQINELLWNKLPVDFTEEQKMAKIKNLLYKMHKNDEIWLDEDRMWHRKES
jgi:ATP-dependent DNA helicase RecG